jgi:hypothetical protein
MRRISRIALLGVTLVALAVGGSALAVAKSRGHGRSHAKLADVGRRGAVGAASLLHTVAASARVCKPSCVARAYESPGSGASRARRGGADQARWSDIWPVWRDVWRGSRSM